MSELRVTSVLSGRRSSSNSKSKEKQMHNTSNADYKIYTFTALLDCQVRVGGAFPKFLSEKSRFPASHFKWHMA